MLLNREIEDLIIKHLRNELAEEERNILEEWKQRSPRNMAAFQKLTNEASLVAELKLFERTDDEAGYNKLLNKILEIGKQKFEAPAGTVVKRMSAWYRVAAAAIIVLLFSIGGYFYFNKKSDSVIAKTEIKNQVAPGGNRAILTLSNGEQVILDSAQNGTLAQQGATKIIKLDSGKLVYNASILTKEIVYNTITTPAGGQFQITLSDGTKVWLNSMASIHFPTAFSGNERRIEMTGEAYFEVAHNPSKPFHVTVNDMDVAVTGTHFNINAYADEGAIKTTLLEGSVTVAKGNKMQRLKPEQQSQVDPSPGSEGEIKLVNADVEQVVAWKNGLFDLKGANIREIMRQISRWYDAEVVYEGNVSDIDFYGVVSRRKDVSELLGLMEKTGIVHFKIQGKKIIVSK